MDLRAPSIRSCALLYMMSSTSCFLRPSVLHARLNASSSSYRKKVIFSASSADEYITNPVLAQYTTKLSASLYILFSSTPANMMPAISSLSILIHNRIRLHRLHPQSASNPRSTQGWSSS